MFSELLMRPYWITLEGIEGVGKTYFARLLAKRLGDRSIVVSEITDQAAESLAGQVITALSRDGDPWLRTGRPTTETIALLALKVSEYESLAAEAGQHGKIVIEDRGVDSVALYQAAILDPHGVPPEDVDALAQRIYATADHWRPSPDLTLLLVDDLDACLARFEARTRHVVSDADRALVARVAQLYETQAAREPMRFRTINRADRSSSETLEELYQACTVSLPAGE
jgi:dTMP kinase